MTGDFSETLTSFRVLLYRDVVQELYSSLNYYCYLATRGLLDDIDEIDIGHSTIHSNIG